MGLKALGVSGKVWRSPLDGGEIPPDSSISSLTAISKERGSVGSRTTVMGLRGWCPRKRMIATSPGRVCDCEWLLSDGETLDLETSMPAEE